MAGRLSGKVAIITGATSGIGQATAEVFVQEGAQVVVSGRNQVRGCQIVEKLGSQATFTPCDVNDERQIAALINGTADRFGRIDVLFNNAGGSDLKGLEDVTANDILRATNLVFSSIVLGIKYAAPLMRRGGGGGCILNCSSLAGLRVGLTSPLYSALKAAVTHYTRIAGTELGSSNIRVNSISPSAIATPIHWGGSTLADRLPHEQNDHNLEQIQQSLAKLVPLQRAGLAQDVAYAALYLASDEGRYVTCHDLVVDGGRAHKAPTSNVNRQLLP